MDSANLALVWSPNLFRTTSTREQINSMCGQTLFVEGLISSYEDVFCDVATGE